MPAVFEFHHTVQEAEIDFLGHVNNLDYLRWMLRAAVAHSDAQGWTTDDYVRLGAGWIVRSHEIEYRRPAFVGEGVIVRTWVADLQRFSSLRRYRILRAADDALLATAATNWAFIDFQTGKLQRIPAEVSSAFIVHSE